MSDERKKPMRKPRDDVEISREMEDVVKAPEEIQKENEALRNMAHDQADEPVDTNQDPIKDLMDLTRGDGHKLKHQLFFLLVFLRDRICCK